MQRARSFLLAAALTATAVSPVFAGPPWISAEYPANPFHTDTKGALMLVHTFHHGATRQYPIAGFAEGMVNGKRQSIPLQVTATYREGVYAVRGALPRQGSWALVVTMTDTDTKARASLIASLGQDGEVVGVSVPNDLKGEWIVPREASRADIDAALRTSVAVASLGKQASAPRPFNSTLASASLLGLMVIGAALRSRLVTRKGN